VFADRGYFKSDEILQCEQDGIKTRVPKPLTSNSKAEGRFDKRDVVYIESDDEYRCPAGECSPIRSARFHTTSVACCPPDGHIAAVRSDRVFDVSNAYHNRRWPMVAPAAAMADVLSLGEDTERLLDVPYRPLRI